MRLSSGTPKIVVTCVPVRAHSKVHFGWVRLPSIPSKRGDVGMHDFITSFGLRRPLLLRLEAEAAPSAARPAEIAALDEKRHLALHEKRNSWARYRVGDVAAEFHSAA